MGDTIKIPLKNKDEIIEIQTSSLPNFNEVHDILKSEHSNLYIWVNLALEYYKKKNSVAFVKLLESSCSNSSFRYRNSNKDRMRVFDLLAAYYVQKANREKNKDKRRGLFSKATQLYTIADKIIMYDVNHILGRAFLCLLEGDKIDQADAQFNFVLDQSSNNIPAQLGKACIAFHRKDYKEALAYYEKVLRSCPNCPADVRLGLAHCFLKLGNIDKARLFFERTLVLEPECIGALVGLAIMKLNSESKSDIQFGVNMLSRAFHIDSTNPIVLNHLSNHFFFKKSYDTSIVLAQQALKNTDNDAIRSQSYYQIARVFHAQNNYNQAFKWYLQAVQFAPTQFVLPYQGLGKMYIHRGQIENAVQCFEKILKTVPESYETMKIIGLLYSDSTNQQKQKIAKRYLKKVTEHDPEDVNALIGLAQILQQSDVEGSLSAYNKSMHIMLQKRWVIPPEILNNVAALNQRLENLDLSLSQLEESLRSSMKLAKTNQAYYSSVVVTTSYNVARIFEAQSQFQKAEELYKDILKENINYIDCYLRLGCMARDRNRVYEAFEFFKDALRIDNDNPDAWLLMGSLHLSQNEWGPAKRKFERILMNPSTSTDSYTLIALGNVWLKNLHQGNRNQIHQKSHQDLALHLYKKVLKQDPKNIWAVNGIGCVLAHMNYINEARKIFSEVREATGNFPDIWLNIAHIYIEQKQYRHGIQMYKNCIKKFYQYDNVEALQYLGHAYYKAGMFEEAKIVYMKAQKVAPQDNVIIYNIALTLQKLSTQIMLDTLSDCKNIQKAVHYLELSQTYFQYLSVHDGHTEYDIVLAGIEANKCKDLICQTKYYMEQARQKEIKAREMRQKKQHDLRLLHVKQAKENAKVRQLKEEKKKRDTKKRLEYKNKTKHLLKFDKVKKQRKRKSKRLKNNGSVNHGESITSVQRNNKRPIKSNNSGNAVDNTNKRKRDSKRQRDNRSSSTDNNIPPSKKLPSSHSSNKTYDVYSSNHKLRILSKVTISTSEDDSSDKEVIKPVSGHSQHNSSSGFQSSRSISKPNTSNCSSGYSAQQSRSINPSPLRRCVESDAQQSSCSSIGSKSRSKSSYKANTGKISTVYSFGCARAHCSYTMSTSNSTVVSTQRSLSKSKKDMDIVNLDKTEVHDINSQQPS